MSPIPRAALRWLLLAVLLLPLIDAQADPASPRIGFLSPSSPEGSAHMLEELRQGLRDYGYVDGANITIESKFADDRFDRLPVLARELIDSHVDVIVTFVTQASIAAKQTTSTVPIVMIGVSDPVASGLVSSLSHPGANVTGTSLAYTGLAGKCVQLLREMVPGVSRVGVLWNPANRVFQAQMLDETRASARQLGVELQLFEARNANSIEAALAAMSKLRIPALTVLPDPLFAENWARISALTAAARLPSVTVSSANAEAGGLMSYGPSIPDIVRATAAYVAKILKGAKPADLPIERPTKFELVINLATAKQIGISVPLALRLRADRLIE